jgi:hypothetical protein
MTCAKIDPDLWRLSFSEPESAFVINVLARLARHYQGDPADMPAAVRGYWQGNVSGAGMPVPDDLREAQEMLTEAREDLRSERLALAESWIREYEIAEERNPWQVEITSEERDEFVAMLNDRRLTLALEIGLKDSDMELDPSHIAHDERRSAILEIDVLGHFILVTLGPQIQRS